MDSQATVTDEILCSRCRKSRPAIEFVINKPGKQKKTCDRHSQNAPCNSTTGLVSIGFFEAGIDQQVSRDLELSEPKFADTSNVRYFNLWDRANDIFCILIELTSRLQHFQSER